MSILVALTGRYCGVIATDGRRTEVDGSFRDDFPKTFRFGSRAILAGYVGLLEVNGRPVSATLEVLVAAIAPSTIDDIADAAKAFYETELTAHPMGPIEQRRLDVVILGEQRRPSSEPGRIRTVCFRAPPGGPMRGEIRAFRTACAGDENATAAITPLVQAVPPNLSRGQLKRLAEDLIRQGVAAAGPHEQFPGVVSCGGGPYLVWYT